MAAVSAPAFSAAPELQFANSSLKPIAITPEKNTGIDRIYVLYDTSGVKASIKTNTSNVKWYRYSNLGGGYAEEVESSLKNGISMLANLEGDMGYIIEDGTDRYYFWVVNYAPKRFNLRSVNISSESGCEDTILDIDANAAPIIYYTINGQRMVLSRDIKISYNNLAWDDNSESYVMGEMQKTIVSIDGPVRISPPIYCASDFTVTGDRFLEKWNWKESKESVVTQPVAVDFMTKAVQTERADDELGSNVIEPGGNELGGSAPAEISFYAYVTDAVIHHEWQMTTDPQFENVEYRFNQQDLTYTFNQEGTFFLRYAGSNSDGSCEKFGDVYTVTIGDSQLRIPNAFSPNGDGVNDVWRVAYRSLLEFKCWIFDRYGKQMYYFDNPDGGWDGKNAKPGVYYYVIQATGADGKKYKKSGDINVLRYVGGQNSGTTQPTE